MWGLGLGPTVGQPPINQNIELMSGRWHYPSRSGNVNVTVHIKIRKKILRHPLRGPHPSNTCACGNFADSARRFLSLKKLQFRSLPFVCPSSLCHRKNRATAQVLHHHSLYLSNISVSFQNPLTCFLSTSRCRLCFYVHLPLFPFVRLERKDRTSQRRCSERGSCGYHFALCRRFLFFPLL